MTLVYQKDGITLRELPAQLEDGKLDLPRVERILGITDALLDGRMKVVGRDGLTRSTFKDGARIAVTGTPIGARVAGDACRVGDSGYAQPDTSIQCVCLCLQQKLGRTNAAAVCSLGEGLRGGACSCEGYLIVMHWCRWWERSSAIHGVPRQLCASYGLGKSNALVSALLTCHEPSCTRRS